MITSRDPATMTEAERLQELAEILARGCVRLLSERQNALACPPPAEALSCTAVNGDGAEAARRSA